VSGIGELCAGYGGLGQAVQQAIGGDIAWVSDIDKGANKVLAHRFPGVPNIGDMTTVDWSQVAPVDVLCGGTPCQDLSHAGKRRGMTEGTRSNLWVAMREAIAQLRPGLVVWENVRGAYSAEADSELEPCAGCVGDGSGVHLRALGRVLGDLSDLGYVGGWHGLRAADVGAPHGRFRVFVVAYPNDSGRREQRWPVAVRPQLAAVEHPSSGALLPTPVADNSRGLPSSTTDFSSLPNAVCQLLPTPAVNDMGEGKTVEAWDEWTAKMKAAHGNGNGHGASLSIEAQRLIPTPSVADAMGGHERRGGKRGEELLLKGMAKEGHLERWGQYADAIHCWEQVTRPAPPPTETGPKGNPRLSAEFSSWMMGVPDGWITDVPGITRNEALKLAGNGVVPAQGAAAIRFLLASLEVAA